MAWIVGTAGAGVRSADKSRSERGSERDRARTRGAGGGATGAKFWVGEVIVHPAGEARREEGLS